MSFLYNEKHQICFWKKRYITYTDTLGYGYFPTFTWDDLHMIPKERPHINKPTPNYKIVNIPRSSDRYDYTAYMPGGLTFGARTGQWEFIIDQDRWVSWAYAFHTISDFFNGERLYVALNDDPTIVYSGRFKVADYTSDDSYSTIKIEYDLDAEPSSNLNNFNYRVRFLDFYRRVMFTTFLPIGAVPYFSTSELPNIPGFEFDRWKPYLRNVEGNIDYTALYKCVMVFNGGSISGELQFIDNDGTIYNIARLPMNLTFMSEAGYNDGDDTGMHVHSITFKNSGNEIIHEAWYTPTNVTFLTS